MSDLTLDYAQIEWRDGSPISKTFGDVYFQIENGLEESEHVFIQPNRIAERLKDESPTSNTLSIFETGFGSGLNFLACYSLWKFLPEPKRNLEFVSVEGYPLSPFDLMTASKQWPQLASLYSELIDRYPPPIRGHHELSFENGRVKLRLLFDSIDNVAKYRHIKADAFFLDGFAPSKNDSMWSEKVLSLIALSANAGASLSTFSAAGHIKRGIETAGFKVTKIKGYGRKREMITAEFLQKPSHIHTKDQPWHLCESTTENRYEKSVIIVGAGIAGLTSALVLARKGYKVKLAEKGKAALSGGSSQRQLITYGKFPRAINAEGRLLLQCQLEAQRFYTQEQSISDFSFWNPIGVMHLGWSNTEREKHKAFQSNYMLPKDFVKLIDPQTASEISGVNIDHPTLFFREAGWIDTKTFSQHVLANPNIEFVANFNVSKISYCGATKQWQAFSENEPSSLTSSFLVLCNAQDARRLLTDQAYPIKELRGQTTQLKSKSLTIPNVVLCGEGYLSPQSSTECHLGATYDLKNKHSEVLCEDNRANIQKLMTWLPDWSDEKTMNDAIYEATAGIRCTNADYHPIVGQVCDINAMQKKFRSLNNNAKAHQTDIGIGVDQLYINTAYGSKGSTYSPSGAMLIANKIDETSDNLTSEQQKMLSPARFLIKKMKRNEV